MSVALTPTIDLFIERLRLFGDEYATVEARVAEAEQVVALGKARLEEIALEAQKLQEAGLLLGFDMFAENSQRWLAGQAETPTEAPPAIPRQSPATAPLKIKDWVLEAAKAAYPEPVLAANLRKRLREMGHEIHDKTVAMSLYRWLREKRIRRDGIKWFWVPEIDLFGQEEEVEK